MSLKEALPEALAAQVYAEEQHYERMAMEQIEEEFVPSFHLGGPRDTFRDLANKHFYELESGLGNEKSAPLFKQLYVTEQQFQK